MQIFRRHWWLVAREAQLGDPGRYVAASLAGWPVFVLRDRGGGLRAFHNVCRHRAGPILQDGAGRCRRLTCRYHGWSYDLDGRLASVPGLRLGEALDPDGHSLFPLRVESWNGMVFACLDDQAPGLAEWLGDIVEIAARFPAVAELAYGGEATMQGTVNWKAYADNACEGYHVKLVHRRLGQALPEEEVTVRGYERGQFVGFDVRYRPSAADPTRRGRGFWIYKFPGLLLHFAEDGFNVEIVTPVAVGAIHLRRWFWFAAGRGEGEARAALSSSQQVMQEDLDICAAVQRNLQAGIYQTGVVLPAQEPGTLFFQHLVRAAFNAFAPA